MSDIKFSDIWQTLSTIDCKEHTKKKDVGRGTVLTYLSWTWAWGITMRHYPSATYTVREWEGKPYMVDPNVGVIVMTEVDIGGNKRPMWLAVMDGANNAMKSEPYTYQVKGRDGRVFDKRVAAVDMCAINKAIMRCLVKNLAMFGLGLNIYAGEDLPVGEEAEEGRAARGSAQGSEGGQQAHDNKGGQQAHDNKLGGGGQQAHDSKGGQQAHDGKTGAGAAGIARKAASLAAGASVNVKRINCSAKGKEAWAAFKALPANRGLNVKQVTEGWRKLLAEVVGGDVTSTEHISDEQWGLVMNQITVEACM